MIDDAGPGAAGGATAPVGRRVGSRSSFVGRQEELSTLVSMLRGPETGVITITGVPGIGKTRLAIEACAHPDKDSRQGGPGDTRRTPTGVPVRSVLVPLAEVSEASSIPLAIAAARQACNYSAERQPAVSIHAPVELLVLDTVEHLPGAAEQVLGLLRDTAGLRVLVTSVRPLDIPGERVIRLGGLGGPADEHRPFEETTESASPGRGSTADSPCVRLYEERARATSASFRLNAPDIDVLHQMCDLLGRIPLTIELAASRVVTVPPALLLARLREDGGLDALRTGRMSDGPVRHQTMHRALTWSYELLEPRARELLAALSVFPGSFTTTGAAELVGDQAPPPGTPPGATTSATGSRH